MYEWDIYVVNFQRINTYSNKTNTVERHEQEMQHKERFRKGHKNGWEDLAPLHASGETGIRRPRGPGLRFRNRATRKQGQN